jgi:DNA-binding MarR family transcriptional regulator
MVPMPADAEPVAEPRSVGAAGYWYPVPGPGAALITSAVEVLRAVRRFRAADAAMRLRARADMDLNDSDLVALRQLIRAEERGEPIGPKDLSLFLGISSAATAKLLSRLESSGRLRREPHPSDRRAQVLHATAAAQAEIRRVMGGAHDRMLAAAERLTPSEQLAVVRFLDELSGAMDAPVEFGAGCPDVVAGGSPEAGCPVA